MSAYVLLYRDRLLIAGTYAFSGLDWLGLGHIIQIWVPLAGHGQIGTVAIDVDTQLDMAVSLATTISIHDFVVAAFGEQQGVRELSQIGRSWRLSHNYQELINILISSSNLIPLRVS